MSDARLLALVLLPRPSSSFLVLPRPSSSSPDLICQLLITVGLAGLHLPALDRREPRPMLLIAMVLAGLQPARV